MSKSATIVAPSAPTTPNKATKTQAQIQAEVDALLLELREAANINEKKRIRRLLRARGHRGGLGERTAKAEPATKPTPTVAKKVSKKVLTKKSEPAAA